MRQLSCAPCGALGCSARRGARSGALGRNKRCMAARGWQPAHKAAEALRARRELQDRPKQILGGLPTRPDEYRALGPAIAPRPRTIKLARPSSSFCGCRARGLRACMPDTRARWPTCPARAACMKIRERGGGGRRHCPAGSPPCRRGAGLRCCYDLPSPYAPYAPGPAPRLPPRARQIGMLGVIISAVAIIMLGYLCVGLAGYLAFPTTVASNVLLSFPPDDWLMQARGPSPQP